MTGPRRCEACTQDVEAEARFNRARLVRLLCALCMEGGGAVSGAITFLNHEGEPTAKERPRRGRGGHFYTPAKTRQAELALGLSFLAAHNRKIATGPVALAVLFCTARPGRRDGDNCLKLLQDAGNGKAWEDDRLIRRTAVIVEAGPPKTVAAWCEIEESR